MRLNPDPLTGPHLPDEHLRAALDGESLGDAQHTAAHLQACPTCRARMEELRRVEQQARAYLNPLAPTPREAPRPAGEAYARLMSKTTARTNLKVREIPMFRRKAFWAALAVFAALALVFTMTPARAWAGTFLNLFRVQKVQVITFNPAAAQGLEDQIDANSAAFKQIFQDDLQMDRRGDPKPAASLDEAAQAVGFTPRIPAALEDYTLTVEPGLDAVLTIDRAKLQELLDLSGVDYQLAPELDGQVVTVNVPDALVITSGCPAPAVPDPNSGIEPSAPDCLTFAQLPSPSVNAPDELDVPRMGEAFFQLLGYAPEEARQLSQRIDWSSTLVLPIPTSSDVTYREAQIDGVTGTILVENDSAMLIWVKGDMLYALRAPNGIDEALNAARSLR